MPHTLQYSPYLKPSNLSLQFTNEIFAMHCSFKNLIKSLEGLRIVSKFHYSYYRIEI